MTRSSVEGLATTLTVQELKGLIWGLIGVASFSLTLPATRLAVAYFDGTFVALGRAVAAGVLAAVVLSLARCPPPSRRDILSLVVVSVGVVVGFPFLTTFAMIYVPASHGAVVIGLLPLATAVAGCLLAGERPAVAFWSMSIAGALVMVGFVVSKGAGEIEVPDLALFGAIAAAAVGYAVGGKLARILGGWQVICWALVLALPVLSITAILIRVPIRLDAPITAWAGFVYVTLVSQFLGFFAWYRGLALGGIAKVGQVQFLQLFMTLLASSVLLGETIDSATWVFGTVIVALVAVGTKLRVRRGGRT